MGFKVIDTGASTAQQNMEIDSRLLETLGSDPDCLLHLYDWEVPSATYGHFSKPYELLNQAGMEKHHLQIAIRPTGGGIIFHQFDFAFSLLLSSSHPKFSMNTLENYLLINKIVSEVISQFRKLNFIPELLNEELQSKKSELTNFCMAKPTIYDVVLEGRKVAGAAQRRTKQGFLHHGSIALILPSDDFLQDVLLPGKGIAEAIKSNSYPLLGQYASTSELNEARQLLKNYLKDYFCQL